MSKIANKEIMKNNASKTSINFFELDRQLPEIVSNHMVCMLTADAIKTEYAKKIGEVAEKIESLKKAEEILSESATPVDNSEAIGKFEAQILELEEEKSAQLEARAKFVPCKAAKDLRKALKDCALVDKSAQKEAVLDFFMAFVGEDSSITREKLANDVFIEEVVGCFGGKHSNKALVQTCVNDARILDVTNAMKMVYDTFFTYGVIKGTVKQAVVPYILFDKYVSAIRRKEEEKAAKKGKKNN